MAIPFAPVGSSQLPNHGMLYSAASQLRTAGATLSVHADQVRSFARTIGPGVWVDASSSVTRVRLDQLAAEMFTGRDALSSAADALDRAGRLVSLKRPRHDQIRVRLRQIQQENLVLLPFSAEANEYTQLAHERGLIERQVESAMREAADAVNRAAALADRFANSGGRLGRLIGGMQDAFKEIGKAIGSFLRGAWDATWEIGATAVSLGIWAAKLHPMRLIFDPQGWARDAEAFGKPIVQFATAFAADPVYVTREVVKAVIDLDTLKEDPAYWVGGLVPGIAAAVFSGGAGAAVRGAKGLKVAEDIGALALRGSQVLKAPTLRITNLILDKDLDLVTRYEKVSAAIAKRDGTFPGGHTLEKHVNEGPGTPLDYALQRQRDVIARKEARDCEGVFFDKNTANDVIRNFLSKYEADIEHWLASDRKDAFAEFIKFDHEIGVATKIGDSPVFTSKAKIVLRKTNELPEGFIVETAYPRYY